MQRRREAVILRKWSEFMVSDEAKRLYSDDGYCLCNGLIPGDLIATARARVIEMLEDQPAWAERSWQLLDPERATNSTGQALPIGIQRPALHEDVFAAIAHHPALIEAMADLLGGDVELFTDQIGVKHGFITEEQGGRSYYHQDSYYWHIDPELGVNCWIPFDDVGADAIAIGVKPGSQRGWQLHEHESYDDNPAWGRFDGNTFRSFQRWRVPLAEIDFSDEKVVPMAPGDGLFFTNYTWHRSEPNRTGQTRMFYAIAYQRA
jgi:hypothetical protein